jgi:hypothetical protein
MGPLLLRSVFLMLGLSLSLPAQKPAPEAVPAPVLRTGEALVIGGGDGKVHAFGEARTESPIGSLAQLVWLRLEGDEWAAQDRVFKCKGSMGSHHCSLAKGHGKVDLKKATEENCDLAFLAWALASSEDWLRSYGEGAARTRLAEVFEPFLGKRLPPGEELPELTMAWAGQGDLLRASPEALLVWLQDPAQAELLSRCRRLLLNFLVETYKPDAWWLKHGTGDGVAAWVVGSNGYVSAVLRVPRSQGRIADLARFREVMGIGAKKK